MPDPNFYIDEFVKELGEGATVEGFTAREFAEHEGIAKRTANAKIEEKILAGKLEVVGSRRMQATDGRMCRVPVYRMKEKDKK